MCCQSLTPKTSTRSKVNFEIRVAIHKLREEKVPFPYLQKVHGQRTPVAQSLQTLVRKNSQIWRTFVDRVPSDDLQTVM